MDKCVFLDRDGTVIIDKNYLKDPEQIELEPFAVEGLRKLSENGYKLVLITNQSGIGRGFFTEEDLQKVHARMKEILLAEGIILDAIYYCPHHPDDHCSCRKPSTGMLEQADRDFAFDHATAAMIGDGKGDIQLALNYGIAAIQVTNRESKPLPGAHFVCDNLLQAAEWILKRNS